MVYVHAVTHPQTRDDCDENFLSVNSLQGHVADVHENGKPMDDDGGGTRLQRWSGLAL